VRQARYVDGQLEGEVLDFYESGAVRERVPYVHDKRHGEALAYYEDGTVMKRTLYREGKQVAAGGVRPGRAGEEGRPADDVKVAKRPEQFSEGGLSHGCQVCMGAVISAASRGAEHVGGAPLNRTLTGTPAANILDGKAVGERAALRDVHVIGQPDGGGGNGGGALGVLTPMPCMPVTPAPWVVGSPTVLLGTCRPHDSAKLICLWGGHLVVSGTIHGAGAMTRTLRQLVIPLLYMLASAHAGGLLSVSTERARTAHRGADASGANDDSPVPVSFVVVHDRCCGRVEHAHRRQWLKSAGAVPARPRQSGAGDILRTCPGHPSNPCAFPCAGGPWGPAFHWIPDRGPNRYPFDPKQPSGLSWAAGGSRGAAVLNTTRTGGRAILQAPSHIRNRARSRIGYWVGNLSSRWMATCRHPPHPRAEFRSLGGNKFYGSFTLISNNGAVLHGDEVVELAPTNIFHTEPQYFAWLDEQFERPEIMLLLLNTKAIVLEINQTNTPCSKAGVGSTSWTSSNPYAAAKRTSLRG
jgi:hypothetical protein